MRSTSPRRLFYFIGSIVIGFVILVVILVLRLGNAYKNEVSKVSESLPETKSVELRKTKTITSVKIEDPDSSGCLEVTSTGVIRKYATCDGNPTQVDRVIDPTRIVRLIAKIGEQSQLSKIKGSSGRVIKLTITTEAGTETYYVTDTDKNDTEIITIIDQIQGDVPATPTPSPFVTSIPTPTWYTPPVDSPTPTMFMSFNTPIPTPVPSGDVPFLCGYTDGKKPTNVSNTMCTTGPTPAY